MFASPLPVVELNPGPAPLATVIWLHGFSYPLGYMWVYRRDLHPVLALVKAGYAVLAYDQCGFGSRMAEIGPFYDRWPHWSQMGRMVDDARTAIDALEQDSLVDARRISILGYTLGGAVALHTAALDSRVRGVFITALIAGYGLLFRGSQGSFTEGLLIAAAVQGVVILLRRWVPPESQPVAMYTVELIADGITVLLFALGVFGGMLGLAAAV